MLKSFPLLLIPVAIYNFIALVSRFGHSATTDSLLFMQQKLFSLAMPSHGSLWVVCVGDIVLFVGLVCLFFEVLKSTGSGNTILLNHTFSMIVFIVCLVEFLLLHPFATSTFFLLMIMTALDVLGGFIVTTISARKDIGNG